MPVRRYAVCDECLDSKKEYMELKDREKTNFRATEIIESGEAEFAEIDGWIVKALPDPDDPIVLMHEFYCPECAALDGVYDSGDVGV